MKSKFAALVVASTLFVSSIAGAYAFLARGTVSPGEIQHGDFLLSGNSKVVVRSQGNVDIDCSLYHNGLLLDVDTDTTGVCWLNTTYTGYYTLIVRNVDYRTTNYTVHIE